MIVIDNFLNEDFLSRIYQEQDNFFEVKSKMVEGHQYGDKVKELGISQHILKLISFELLILLIKRY